MSFSMEVTNTEEIKKEIIEQVKPIPEEVAKLKALAENNVSEIMTLDLESLEKEKRYYNQLRLLEWKLFKARRKEILC